MSGFGGDYIYYKGINVTRTSRYKPARRQLEQEEPRLRYISSIRFESFVDLNIQS